MSETQHFHLFWRSSSFYRSVFSSAFLSNATILAISLAHAVLVAKHYGASDVHRASNGIVGAILLIVFFLGMCIHRSKTRRVLETHQVDEAVLREMSSTVTWATNGFCALSILMLHPIV